MSPKRLKEVGHVRRSFSGVATLEGLPSVFLHEALLDERGEPAGIVMGFSDEGVQTLLFDETVPPGTPLYRSGKIFSIDSGDEHVGRVLNGMGLSRDDLPYVAGTERPVFATAPPIIARSKVERPLITGVKVIDATLPLGRGQRELIIGDRKLGKSAIARDAVIYQGETDDGALCVYVLCGRKRDELADLVDTFTTHGAMGHTVIVAATAADSYAERYLAPFVGCAIAEHFRDAGKDVLVVYDDLTQHAKAYREIKLMFNRPPGREMYPADIFSLHAQLLERAGQLDAKHGGGSLTALPIIETQAGDVTAFVPTNLISITDGQIYLERGLQQKGFLPAVNVGLSVSRLGAQVQPPPLKRVTAGLRLALAQQKELQKLTQLETQISKETSKRVHRGELTLELLKQGKHRSVPVEEQVFLFYAVENGHFDDLEKEEWTGFEQTLRDLARSRYPDTMARIREGAYDAGLEKEMQEIVAYSKKEFLGK